MPTAGRVLAFALFFVVYDQILRLDAARAGPAGGANIGAGLLAFALIVVAALGWAALDRRRGLSWPALLIRWSVVAVAVGLWSPISLQLGEGGFDGRVLAADLVSLGPFSAGLVFVPAALGGLVRRAPATRTRPTV